MLVTNIKSNVLQSWTRFWNSQPYTEFELSDLEVLLTQACVASRKIVKHQYLKRFV